MAKEGCSVWLDGMELEYMGRLSPSDYLGVG